MLMMLVSWAETQITYRIKTMALLEANKEIGLHLNADELPRHQSAGQY
jgi:hypothetical protein